MGVIKDIDETQAPLLEHLALDTIGRNAMAQVAPAGAR